LLVPFAFRSSYTSVRPCITNFGKGALDVSDSLSSIPRRGLLRAAFVGAAAGLVAAAPSPARAQQKMTKQEAEYQDSPRDIRMCATCTLFEPPKACKVVEGDVSPNGWCKAFALAD
jgi:hypothetical protein